MVAKAAHLWLADNSFRPPEEIRLLRGYLRQRENLVAAAATCIQHMQKALTEMNIQLANVISDISGTTGLAILYDIVRGERDLISWRCTSTAGFAPAARDCSQSARHMAAGVVIRSGTKSGSLQTYQQKIKHAMNALTGN